MKLENVCFSYGDKAILDNFSLSLPDTGVVALSGPSGCGKTTLLRLIAGLETPKSGTVTSPGLPDTAVLFQEDRLLPGFSASIQLKAVLKRGADITKYLDAVGLSGEANTKIEALSGGMRRRVALARAMAFVENKRLLVLDEPFTGVDSETAKRIMTALRAENLPILYSAHDAESLALADTVLHLSGPPLTVI